jgi:hypothetical protein
LCRITGNEPTNTNDPVCRQPPGDGDLGAVCEAGADCRSGLCLRSTRFTGETCTTAEACQGEEICRCPIDNPDCSEDQMRCAEELRRCTYLCGDDEDCTGGVGDHGMTICADDISIALPDDSGSSDVSACSDRD